MITFAVYACSYATIWKFCANVAMVFQNSCQIFPPPIFAIPDFARLVTVQGEQRIEHFSISNSSSNSTSSNSRQLKVFLGVVVAQIPPPPQPGSSSEDEDENEDKEDNNPLTAEKDTGKRDKSRPGKREPVVPAAVSAKATAFAPPNPPTPNPLKPPLGRGSAPLIWGAHLDAPGQRRRQLPSSVWTPHKAVKQGKSRSSAGTTYQGKERASGEVRTGQGGGWRAQGGERPMGTAARGGKVFKGRAAVSGDWPIGAAGCRQHHIQASCQTPPQPSCPAKHIPALSLHGGAHLRCVP